jgi:sugar O-acyltransferase (sialic acid O-acetyltransferase NeuD family)
MEATMIYCKYFKRMFDIVGALLLAMLFAAPFATIALLVRLKLGSPVIFRQTRPGLRERPFVMCKLRTMTDGRDVTGELLPDEQRLTKFGRFLRSTSLDEVPGLWNVIRGEMSLIGPRPLLMRYIERYSDEQRRRHEVKPGLTGWAQVNGRNAIDWDEKLAFDVWYVDHRSFWLDLYILILTVVAVLKRSDVNRPGHATAPEFMGPGLCTVRTLTTNVPNGVVVLGASGHAKVVISTLRAAGEQVIAAFDDNATLWGGNVLGVPIIGAVDSAASYGAHRAVIAIGNNRIRQSIAARVKLQWVTVQHPSAYVDESARLGVGTVVMAGAVIQPEVIVGSHSIINTCASVDHDCQIGDYAHLGPGVHLSGDVTVGEAAFLGTGTSVIQGRRIGVGTTVGAGGVVIRDLPDHVTAVGCPAQVIHQEASMRKVA